MEKEWDIVEVLRHSRHDWLNRLQLIKGNLELGRVEKVKDIIDQIIIESQQESKLSNLHMPMFASLLLKSNWENRLFYLEYEVLEESDCLAIDDTLLSSWTSDFFSYLNSAIEPFQEHHLSITIDPQKEGARFFFDFSGIIKKEERIEQFLAKSSETDWLIEIKEFSLNEFALEVFIPKAKVE
ncbi:MAG: sporulation initiation phosphotransferase B [Bacillota bacterium]|nr:sporulation initiation phosphotransferase B [Bacillota bacterium]